MILLFLDLVANRSGIEGREDEISVGTQTRIKIGLKSAITCRTIDSYWEIPEFKQTFLLTIFLTLEVD